jgi:rubrerythrin
MSVVFSPEELLNIAVGIEKQGVAYYDVMAKSSWHEVAGDMFKHLLEMEKEHVATFQGMLDKIVNPESITKPTAEYIDYMNALVNSAVFNDELAASELASHIDNEIEALDIAMSTEKDSILFYYILNELLPASSSATIKKIITEEKAHLSLLAQMKQKLISL